MSWVVVYGLKTTAGTQSNVFAQLWNLARVSVDGRTMGARRERMSGVERVDRKDGEKSMGPAWGKEDMVREGAHAVDHC